MEATAEGNRCHTTNEKCSKCDKQLKINDNSVECFTCKLVFHASCHHISDTKYEILCGAENEGIFWFCVSCRRTTRGLLQHLSNIAQRLKVIEDERESEKKEMSVLHRLLTTFNGKLFEVEENSNVAIQEIQEDLQSIRENVCDMLKEVPQVTMSSLETRFSNIEGKLAISIDSSDSVNTAKSSLHDTQSKISKSSPSKSITSKMSSVTVESNEEFMIEVANEVDDRQKRRKTLVIHNIDENDDAAEDYVQVTNILSEIINDDNLIRQQLADTYRLGRRNPCINRTVKVHFKSEDFCRSVLQHTRKLRDSSYYKHIVFQPDLTPTQRHHLKMLVEEKKQRNWNAKQCNEEPDWTIRIGKLCRRRDISNF